MIALICIEFGTALPYNGGPLIWLNATFHRPKLLTSIIFSVFWIPLATSAASSSSFATYVLHLMYPTFPIGQLDNRWLKFVQAVTQGVVCLALYFAYQLCMKLNKLFAIFKVCLIIAFSIAGFMASREGVSGLNDFRHKQEGYAGIDALSAMIYVIHSYQGWEYSNYIAGEFKAPKRTLRIAMLLAIGTITVLYLLVTSAFFMALTYESITSPNNLFSFIEIFSQKAFGRTTGANVALALSALGNLLAITHIECKVTQAIAWQGFIPFAKFIGRNSNHFGSPGGALLLHWILMVIFIIVVPKSTDDYTFSLGTFVYGYQVMMVFVGLGLIRLGQRMLTLEGDDWKPVYLTTKYSRYFVGGTFAALNLLIIYMTARPHQAGTIPRFYWSITIAAVVVMGVIYWMVLKALQTRLAAKIGFQLEIHQSGDDDIPEDLRTMMIQATQDGSRMRVSYKACLVRPLAKAAHKRID